MRRARYTLDARLFTSRYASPQVLTCLVQWSSDSHHQTRRACVEAISSYLNAVDAASVTPQQISAGDVPRARQRDAPPNTHLFNRPTLVNHLPRHPQNPQISTRPCPSAVMGVLKARTADANNLVRNVAAKTFWQVNGLSPERVDAVLPTLEPAQQKMLKRNRP